MHEPATGTPARETAESAAPVTVRYWAAARAAAGRAEDAVTARTVSDALKAARSLHTDNPRFAQVLGISSLLLGDQPIRAADIDAVPVSAGDVIEVLPPFAGG